MSEIFLYVYCVKLNGVGLWMNYIGRLGVWLEVWHVTISLRHQCLYHSLILLDQPGEGEVNIRVDLGLTMR